MRELILAYLKDQKALQRRLLDVEDKHDSYGRGYRDGSLETLQQIEKWALEQDEVEISA